jgi:hypothetical protein
MTCKYLVLLLGMAFCATTGLSIAQDKPPAKTPEQAKPGEWRPLFDGKTLDGWKETPFTARGKVSVEDGTVILGTGYMTGITWTRSFPKANYEVRYEAARIQGGDFFGAITFPVHDSFCTWVSGGWGGMLVGLSSLDLMDASENETTLMLPFNRGQWYAFRLRVTDYTIEAWIDEERVIAVDFSGRQVGLRPGEIELSIPLGFASYRTVGALRKIEYRRLPPAGEGK